MFLKFPITFKLQCQIVNILFEKIIVRRNLMTFNYNFGYIIVGYIFILFGLLYFKPFLCSYLFEMYCNSSVRFIQINMTYAH